MAAMPLYWPRMATVGLVGGLGPESTIDYYRRILDGWQRLQPGTAPSIVIDSLDVQRGLHLVAHDRPGLVDYLSASLDRLAGAGVDFAAMTANTPHLVFDELAGRTSLPLLSIVEVCLEAAQRRQLSRLLLLGTSFTMEAGFYAEVFGRRGATIVTPAAEERAWIHERYVGELLQGVFSEATRQAIVSLVVRSQAADGIDGVILGGTELPLLLKDESIAGVPALDTTALHVAAIVDRLRGSAGAGR
jgi:aspartate racemase